MNLIETIATEKSLTSPKKADLSRRNPSFWERAVRFFSWFIPWYTRMEVDGVENIPTKGQPGLLCPNHPGLLDPVFLHTAVHVHARRWLRWLGWAELANSKNRFFRWMVKNVGTMVPVEQHHGQATNADSARAALLHLTNELQQGHLVGVFPEGTNHNYGDYDEPYKFHTGALLLAARTGAPIIPVGMYGSHRVWPTLGEIKKGKFHFWLAFPFWFPAKVKIRFGQPFYVDPRLAEGKRDYKLLRAEAERLKKTIYDLARSLY